MPKEQFVLTPEDALRLLLDQVDYTSGACSAIEMVGACLSKDVIDTCKKALAGVPSRIKAQ